jgi:hypothetical protein
MSHVLTDRALDLDTIVDTAARFDGTTVPRFDELTR